MFRRFAQLGLFAFCYALGRCAGRLRGVVVAADRARLKAFIQRHAAAPEVMPLETPSRHRRGGS